MRAQTRKAYNEQHLIADTWELFALAELPSASFKSDLASHLEHSCAVKHKTDDQSTIDLHMAAWRWEERAHPQKALHQSIDFTWDCELRRRGFAKLIELDAGDCFVNLASEPSYAASVTRCLLMVRHRVVP